MRTTNTQTHTQTPAAHSHMRNKRIARRFITCTTKAYQMPHSHGYTHMHVQLCAWVSCGRTHTHTHQLKLTPPRAHYLRDDPCKFLDIYYATSTSRSRIRFAFALAVECDVPYSRLWVYVLPLSNPITLLLRPRRAIARPSPPLIVVAVQANTLI